MMKKLLYLFLLFLFISPTNVNASQCQSEFSFNFVSNKCEKIVLPEHGVMNQDKNNWNCEVGYKKIASQNTCEKVAIPDNARLNYSGDDFICDRGYQKKSDTCTEIKLPENGVLEATGNDWGCIATYKRSLRANALKREEDVCIKVEVPKDAKFFDQGFDWYCNNQFRKEGQECKKFEIPANAHLTYLGNDWQCNEQSSSSNRGFVKNREKNTCEALFIPLNAQVALESFVCDSGYDKQGDKCVKTGSVEQGKFYEQGSQFYCETGFRKNEELRKCEKIEIPQNAQADKSSLNGWSCLGGYIEKDDKCEKFTTDHIVWIDNTWTCEAGYKKDYNSMNCQKVSLPENAHLETNTDGWACNVGFTKNYRENRCEKKAE